MKRHLLRLSVLLLCIAALFLGKTESGLLSVVKGEYFIFIEQDGQFSAETALFRKRGEYERVDLVGDESVTETIIEKACATVKKRESIGETSIVYAYTVALGEGVYTDFGRVNLMIACSNGRISVGSPLLKGSF